MSARAEGESRVLGGAECDQGSEREQCTYINSLKENVSAQTQIIEGKKNPKPWSDESDGEWIAEAIRKTLL